MTRAHLRLVLRYANALNPRNRYTTEAALASYRSRIKRPPW